MSSTTHRSLPAYVESVATHGGILTIGDLRRFVNEYRPCVVLQRYHQHHKALVLYPSEIVQYFPGQVPECTVFELRLQREDGDGNWHTYYEDIYTPSLEVNDLILPDNRAQVSG